MLDIDRQIVEVNCGAFGSGAPPQQLRLSWEIFGQVPRSDILHRVVRWQQAKARSGTHQVQNRSDVSLTGKKSVAQKGSGGARHGNRAAPQYRGGGRAFGPVTRSHAFNLPKKIRALGLRHALSVKAQADRIYAVESLNIEQPKTKLALFGLERMGMSDVLIVHGHDMPDDFALAVRNLKNVDVMPVEGINVYDILNHEWLMMTLSAIDAVTARFLGELPARSDTPSRTPGASTRRTTVARGGVVADATSRQISAASSRLDPAREVPTFRPEQLLEPTLNPDDVEVLILLGSSDPQARKRSMRQIDASSVPRNLAPEVKSRLLPLVLSGTSDDAFDAAFALCRVAFPERYAEFQRPYRVKRSHDLLDRMRFDLERVMVEEQVQFAVYTDLLPSAASRTRNVKITASRTLRLDLGEEPVHIGTADSPTPTVKVIAGGRGLKAEVKPVVDSKELYEAVLECKLSGKEGLMLSIDIFVDGEWSKRLDVEL